MNSKLRCVFTLLTFSLDLGVLFFHPGGYLGCSRLSFIGNQHESARDHLSACSHVITYVLDTCGHDSEEPIISRDGRGDRALLVNLISIVGMKP